MSIENPVSQLEIDELSELELADKFEYERDGFEAFYKRRELLGPHSEVVEAIDMVKNKEKALEIGPGTHNEVRYMIEQGFHVTAIGPDNTDRYSRDIDENKLTSLQGDITNFNFEANQFDFINASLVFPFIDKEKWQSVISGLKKALKSEGVFVGIFFGENSIMVTKENNASTNVDEIRSFFEDGFEIKKLEELGPKSSPKGMYHSIVVIAKKE